MDLPLLVLAGLISGNGTGFVAYLGLAIILVVAVPTISLTARRLHDSGHSAGWMLGPVVFAIPMPMLALTYALSCFDVCGPRSRGLATALRVDFWLFAASAAGMIVLLVLPARRQESGVPVTR